MNSKDATELAYRLMTEHNLNFWRLRIGQANRTLSLCNFGQSVITLSEIFIKLNTEERVRRTILHEIAHALVGPNHGHNDVWRQKCIEIGGDGRRLASDANLMNPKYITYCTGCKKELGTAFRRGNYYCIKCLKRTGKKIFISYKDNKYANLPRIRKDKSIDNH